MPNFWYDHIHLMSPDPVKTAQFYQDLFGAKVIRTIPRADGRASVALDFNGSRLSIIEPKNNPDADTTSNPSYGINHFGIGTDDLQTAVKELKANGVEFTEEIREAPGVKVSFLLGPDDVLIELLERTG